MCGFPGVQAIETYYVVIKYLFLKNVLIAVFGIDIPKLSDSNLIGLLRKRLGALAIITDDLREEREKLDADRKLIGKTEVFPENKPLYLMTEPERKLHFALKRIEDNQNQGKELEADLHKRAQQIILISQEMRKRRIRHSVDLTRLHPIIRSVFNEELEKAGFPERKNRTKKLKPIPKQTRDKPIRHKMH